MASLYLLTFDRGYDFQQRKKPYHWAFLIEDKDINIIHQLRGVPGNYNYPGVEEFSTIEFPNPLLHKVEVGEIPKGEVDTLEGLFGKIAVDLDESTDWNCQSWAKEAYEIMKGKGWIWMEFDQLKAWVVEQ